MSYEQYSQAFSRIPITVVELMLDTCLNIFGQAPCAGTGAPCYGTFQTCKSKKNFRLGIKPYRVYSHTVAACYFPRLSSAWGAFKWGDAITWLPETMQPRPFVEQVDYLPTEIKQNNLTVAGRVKIKCVDPPDSDVDTDPYYRKRTDRYETTFFRRLVARLPNYKGRFARLFEGFVGMNYDDFQERFCGVLYNITLDRGYCTIEIEDILKQLATVDLPRKLDVKLTADITETATTMTVTNPVSLVPLTGYIRLKDEIISYTSIDATGAMLNCVRGVYGTVAVAHNANDKIQEVVRFEPQNPFDLLVALLTTYSKIPPSQVDRTAFERWKTGPVLDQPFMALISEPAKVADLYWEIVDILGCKSWVNEDAKITISRNLPNCPGRTYHDVSDTAHIVRNSADVDLNVSSRLSRCTIYWDLISTGKLKTATDYNRAEVAIDADSEGAVLYNTVSEKIIYCRWWLSGFADEDKLLRYARVTALRHVARHRDPQAFITCTLEEKDSYLKTGDYVMLSTDELCLPTGAPLSSARGQIVRRERQANNGIKIKIMLLRPRKIAFFGSSAAMPAYLDATERQREYGYFSDNDVMTSGDVGYGFL